MVPDTGHSHTEAHTHEHIYTMDLFQCCHMLVQPFLWKATGTGECSMGHPFSFASLQEHTVNCTRTPVLTSAVWMAEPATARAWTARASVHQGSQVSGPWVCFQTHCIVPMAAEVGQPQTFCHEWLQSRDAIVKCQGHGFNKIHFKTIDYVVIKLGSSEASISHLDLLALPSLYVSRAGALKHKPWAHENTCKCQCSCSMNGTGRIKHVFCVNSIQTPLSVIKVTVLVLGRKDSG